MLSGWERKEKKNDAYAKNEICQVMGGGGVVMLMQRMKYAKWLGGGGGKLILRG